MPSTEREQASSLPSFLQRNELDGTEHIPMGFIIVAILIVIGAVGYAVRYLSRQQAEDAARKVQQANKRAARKNKKGKPIDDDKSVVEEEGEPLGALADAGSMVLGIAKEFIVVLLVVLVVVEGWRWIPRVAVVPCHHVLGRDDDGSKCVVVPGVEDPLECSMYASRPSPRGSLSVTLPPSPPTTGAAPGSAPPKLKVFLGQCRRLLVPARVHLEHLLPALVQPALCFAPQGGRQFCGDPAQNIRGSAVGLLRQVQLVCA
eukprot:TRINITY_DN11829_c0_g1_i3.p1 TRINITY_DN11829_c0_g1~~TRINITY_DN11829_c0_g1_i3.p1  ORF type:complete len:260 (+),score=59.74 TRINITY_DN11829_c0_g1_i3:179-958(+)